MVVMKQICHFERSVPCYGYPDVIKSKRKIKEQLTSKHPNETKNELSGIITAILS